MGVTAGLLEQNIYHMGAILIAGKLHAHNSFPHVSGSHGWSWYYHIYNCLGDPELPILTYSPGTMTVGCNNAIPVGTNYLDIHVDGENLRPLAGAYVCLVKGHEPDEEVFTGGWTDENGNLRLDFNTTVSDTMYVTVSCRNYIPHLGACLVNDQPTMVAFNDMTIGGDGIANPTDTIDLSIELKNFGASGAATNVGAALSSDNPSAQVLADSISYPDIPPGEVRSSDGFIIHFDGNIPHDEVLSFPLTVTTDEGVYESRVCLQVKSMQFSHTGHSFPNGGSDLDPGETTEMMVNLDNIGELDGVDLTGALRCNDPLISILDNSASFGTINAGQSGSNDNDYFVVSADACAYDGRNVNFELELSSAAGIVATTIFSLTLGDVDMYDAIGPDDYGYYMYENIDVGYGELAPVYDWYEISGIGTRLSFYDSDDASALVALPFGFVYYGHAYSHIIVSTNGFIAIDTAQTMPGRYHHNWDNYPLPDPGNARGQISPFWDDMRIVSGGIYTYHDTERHVFVIEWNNLQHSLTNSPETFQTLIYDPAHYETPTGDAEIVFQYRVINNNDNNSSDPDEPAAYSSIGFENWTEDDGIQYEWNNIYHPAAAVIAAGRAIKITTNSTQLVGINESSDVIPQGYALFQNNPNPFNMATSIQYNLPQAANVKIEIYDILGQKVAMLVDGRQAAGQHNVIWKADKLGSGVYFYQIQADDFSSTRKMLLIK